MNPSAAVTLLPPEERFWKRHSPHGEGPLSLAGSLALHGLAVGTLLLFAVYLAAVFFQPERSLPIEPVQLAGGAAPGNAARGPGPGSGGLREDDRPDTDAALGSDEKEPPLPQLTPLEKKQIEERFEPDLRPQVAASPTGRRLARMEKQVQRQLLDGLKAGPGNRGSNKDGAGAGADKGKTKGTLKRNERIERMLRWHMRFSASSGEEYLNQLRGLGAILAIPVAEKPEPDYRIVRDLRAPARLKKEDLAKINRIYWIDDKPSSVRDVMKALGLDLRPQRFVAFMPEKLERELYDRERRYVENVLGEKFDEKRIESTEFRVVGVKDTFRKRGYQVEVITVRLK